MREGVWGGWRMMKCMGWQGGWGRSGRVGSPLPSATANASPARRRRAPRLPTHPFGTLKRLEIPTVPAPADICRLLEAGQAPERVYQLLVDRAADRRGSDVERYAHRTVERAMMHTRQPR